MRTILLDGDIIVYQVAAAVETPVDWGDGVFTLQADLKEAQGRAAAYIEDLASTLSADRVVIALKDSANWRKAILPSYKAHRTERAPMVRVPLHEWMKTEYECFQRPTLEGDDVLGILATNPNVIKGEKIVVSPDKDLRTVPGLLYNPGKPDLGVQEISGAYADYWHMRQTLTGDSTDGYPGCPKVGPVKAERLLILGMHPLDAWTTVVATYEKHGSSADAALVQARVARICRWTDYDYKRKEVKLWEPPR